MTDSNQDYDPEVWSIGKSCRTRPAASRAVVKFTWIIVGLCIQGRCCCCCCCLNLANGVTQPDLLQQQDLATVATPPNNQRHWSTVKTNAPRTTRVYRADWAAEQDVKEMREWHKILRQREHSCWTVANSIRYWLWNKLPRNHHIKLIGDCLPATEAGMSCRNH